MRRFDPQNYREFTDKYFLRSEEILRKDGVNPYLRMQVFSRLPGEVHGIEDVIEILENSPVKENGGHLYCVDEGEFCDANETVMVIDSYIQDSITYETVILGLLSEKDANLDAVYKNAREIVEAAEDKDVYYFGARHFHPDLDYDIAKACFEAGMKGCSTDNGAVHWNRKGVGTIPHILVLAYAAEYPEENATVKTALAFDKYIDENVPRIVLIDTFNREVSDSLEAAEKLKGNLSGVRIDTAGENAIQYSSEVVLPEMGMDEKYLRGRGVKVQGIWGARRKLDEAGYHEVDIFLSSGFDAEKTRAFVEADRVYQKMHGRELFRAIGTGSVYKSRHFTMDCVQRFENGKWVRHAKAGREMRWGKKLKKVF